VRQDRHRGRADEHRRVREVRSRADGHLPQDRARGKYSTAVAGPFRYNSARPRHPVAGFSLSTTSRNMKTKTLLFSAALIAALAACGQKQEAPKAQPAPAPAPAPAVAPAPAAAPAPAPAPAADAAKSDAPKSGPKSDADPVKK